MKHNKMNFTRRSFLKSSAMGMGAAATKYSVFASLSNTPIAYMTNVDGWAHTRWGPGGMLYAEAVSGAIGLALFAGVMMVAGRVKPAAAPVAAAAALPATTIE